MKHPLLFLAAALLLATGPLAAVQTRQAVQQSFNDFIKGELENLSIDERGVLRPAPELVEHAAHRDPIIWSAVAGADGTLYLGTGNDGAIVEVSPAGETREIFNPEEILIRGLALGPDGALYVGSSPKGRVYRIPPKAGGGWGSAEIYFDPPEVYIWDLRFDREGRLFVATGQSARIYRLPPDFQPGRDEAEVYFRSIEMHFSSMAFDRNGDLLVGSGPNGFLYRVTGPGAGFALFNADVPEIRSILPREDGTILFATFSDGGRRGSSSSGSRGGDGGSDGSDRSDDNGSGSNASEVWTVTAFSGSGSEIYELGADGFVELFWELPDVQVYSILEDSDGRILVGAGKDGRIFRVNDRQDWELLAQAPTGGDISVLAHDPEAASGAVLVFASNPARVYRLGGTRAPGAQFTSDIVDAEQIVAWGAFDARGESGARIGPDLAVETRTGNTPRPDATWSAYTPLAGERIASPTARYLQYRVRWSGGDGESLRAVRTFYRMKNRAPFIRRINIIPGSFSLVEGQRPRLNMDISKLTDSSSAAAVLQEPPARKQLVLEREEAAMTAGWDAFDPNGDRMIYAVDMRGPNQDAWLRVADGLEDPVYAMNLHGLEEGYHRLRVTASDRPDNVPAEARSFSLVSEPYLIDLTQPDIAVEMDDAGPGQAAFRFEAADRFGVIALAGYSLNGGDAVRLLPVDGLHDGRTEVFELELDGLEPGSHSLVFEVYDERDNVGRKQVAFSVK